MEVLRDGMMDQNQIQSDYRQFCQNWIWRAVNCLIMAPDFEPSPKWAAKRLNVSVDKIVEAFEGLERLGYIQRSGNSYSYSNDLIDATEHTLTAEEMISIHSRLAPQIISKLTKSSRFTTQIFIGDKALVDEYAPKIGKLLNEMREKGLAQKSKEVIAIELGIATLTEEVGGGK